MYSVRGLSKDRVSNYAWKQGSGVRSVLALTLKLRINKRGDDIKIPHLCVYLFNKNKEQINKIERFMYKSTSGATEGGNEDSFTGNKTYILQFPYKIEEKFRYAIGIVGNDDECHVVSLPKTLNIDEFEFDEKKYIK